MAGTAQDALELHTLDVAEPGVLPFAIGAFDTIGPLATADIPHRHSFYEIGLVTHGSGAHVVDLVRHELAPPYLYALVPGQPPPPGGGGTWVPGVSYQSGDQVTYSGTTYRCLQAHTSMAGWEPPNVPALWQPV